MPRSARIVIPGTAHHVTKRGNNKGDVFLDASDREKYLDLLRHYCAVSSLRIVAYCLMRNHIHLVAVPGFENSLADAMGHTHQRYTDYFHDKYARSGHVWQGRFYSCPMDMEHTMNALAYVELNPVRTGIVAEPWDYTWSSAAPHAGLRGDPLLNLNKWFTEFSVEGWIEALGGKRNDTGMAEEIRRCTLKGRPLGKNPRFRGQVDQWYRDH